SSHEYGRWRAARCRSRPLRLKAGRGPENVRRKPISLGSCSYTQCRNSDRVKPPDFWLVKQRSRGAAAGLAKRIAEFLRETRLFMGLEKAGDRQLFAARNQKKPINPEFFQLDLVEPNPERI